MVRFLFKRFISLPLGFDNLKQQWLERYENEDFANLVEKVWSEPVNVGNGTKVSLEDFYKQFHAYVRSKLRLFYPVRGGSCLTRVLVH